MTDTELTARGAMARFNDVLERLGAQPSVYPGYPHAASLADLAEAVEKKVAAMFERRLEEERQLRESVERLERLMYMVAQLMERVGAAARDPLGDGRMSRATRLDLGLGLPEVITLEDQIACVEREIRMRRVVYAQRVAAGAMSASKAEREIAVMEAVLKTLGEFKCEKTTKPPT